MTDFINIFRKELKNKLNTPDSYYSLYCNIAFVIFGIADYYSFTLKSIDYDANFLIAYREYVAYLSKISGIELINDESNKYIIFLYNKDNFRNRDEQGIPRFKRHSGLPIHNLEFDYSDRMMINDISINNRIVHREYHQDSWSEWDNDDEELYEEYIEELGRILGPGYNVSFGYQDVELEWNDDVKAENSIILLNLLNEQKHEYISKSEDTDYLSILFERYIPVYSLYKKTNTFDTILNFRGGILERYGLKYEYALYKEGESKKRGIEKMRNKFLEIKKRELGEKYDEINVLREFTYDPDILNYEELTKHFTEEEAIIYHIYQKAINDEFLKFYPNIENYTDPLRFIDDFVSVARLFVEYDRLVYEDKIDVNLPISNVLETTRSSLESRKKTEIIERDVKKYSKSEPNLYSSVIDSFSTDTDRFLKMNLKLDIISDQIIKKCAMELTESYPLQIILNTIYNDYDKERDVAKFIHDSIAKELGNSINLKNPDYIIIGMILLIIGSIPFFDIDIRRELIDKTNAKIQIEIFRLNKIKKIIENVAKIKLGLKYNKLGYIRVFREYKYAPKYESSFISIIVNNKNYYYYKIIRYSLFDIPVPLEYYGYENRASIYFIQPQDVLIRILEEKNVKFIERERNWYKFNIRKYYAIDKTKEYPILKILNSIEKRNEDERSKFIKLYRKIVHKQFVKNLPEYSLDKIPTENTLLFGAVALSNYEHDIKYWTEG